MTCQKCGAEVDKSAAFCHRCGAQLANSSASTTPGNLTATPNAPTSVSGAAGRRGRAVEDVPEETLWEGSYSPKAMIGTWIFLGIVGMIAVVFTVYLLVQKNAYWWAPLVLSAVLDTFMTFRYFLKRYGTRYRLTNHRFFHETGILSRTVNPIDLITITDVSYQQGLVERMVNVGRVTIMSSDTSDPVLAIDGIEDVAKISSLIDKTRREETMRRRVFFDATPHA